MNHVMLDIETLGDESGSIITSIGAVQFDIETGVTKKWFHKHIDIQSAFDRGLKMNPSTVLWWMEQNDLARKLLLNGNKNALDIVNVLSEFGQWLSWLQREDVTTGSRPNNYDTNELFIWGRGPRFDMGILADAYRTLNMAIPWNTRKELCVRTMEFLNPTIKKEMVALGNSIGKHDALLDCYTQIAYVYKIYNESKSTK